ncbi:hypothetical protein UlMin_031214 [Ulmus minor]
MASSIELGSFAHDHPMFDLNGAAEGEEEESSPLTGGLCSICLEVVLANGGRSQAKLQCGHEFHLDCIGSAFNSKGVMECPNCRAVENGQWLYANGSAHALPEDSSLPEFNLEDFIPDEDPDDLSNIEMPLRFQWCPFGSSTQIHSSFEELESSQTAYHQLLEQQAVLVEQATSPVPHSHVAYSRQVPPASSISSTDDLDFGNSWTSVTYEVNPQIFPGVRVQYQTRARQSQPGGHVNIVNPATLRSVHSEPNAMVRSRSHLIRLGQGSGTRVGSSFINPVVPHLETTTAPTHEAIGPFHQQQPLSLSSTMQSPTTIPNFRRFERAGGSVSALVPTPPALFYAYLPSSSDRNTHEAEHHLASQFLAREHSLPFPAAYSERDSSWGSGGSDSGNGSGNIWHRSWP